MGEQQINKTNKKPMKRCCLMLFLYTEVLSKPTFGSVEHT